MLKQAQATRLMAGQLHVYLTAPKGCSFHDILIISRSSMSIFLSCLPCLPAVIWDAIKAACEAEDMATTRLILETAGVIVARADMTVMYDERGARYALPKYVLCDPTNVLKGPEQQVQMQPRRS